MLIISHNPTVHLETIKAHYELNPSSIGMPERYLVADVKRVTRPGDPTALEYGALKANTCIKNAVKNVKLL